MTYGIQCRFSGGETVDCRGIDKRAITLVSIGSNLYRLTIALPKPNRYSVELELPIGLRCVCNGELYGELGWGSNRIVRFDTLNPVKQVDCIIGGSIRLMEYRDLLIAYVGEINKELLENLYRIYSLWRTITDNKIYTRYSIIIGVDIYPTPPLLSSNTKLFMRGLVESTLMMQGIEGSSKLSTVIDKLIDSLSKQEINPLLYVIAKQFWKNKGLAGIGAGECLEHSAEGGKIVVRNKCRNNIRIYIVGSKGFIETTIGPGGKATIDKELIGSLELLFEEKYIGKGDRASPKSR